MVPEEGPFILLDSKSNMCMDNNGRDTKHTRHIASRMHFVTNGDKCKMIKIDQCAPIDHGTHVPGPVAQSSVEK